MNCDSSIIGVIVSAAVGLLGAKLLQLGSRPKPPPPADPIDIEEALEADAKADYEKEQIEKQVEAELVEDPKPPEVMDLELEDFRKRRGR